MPFDQDVPLYVCVTRLIVPPNVYPSTAAQADVEAPNADTLERAVVAEAPVVQAVPLYVNMLFFGEFAELSSPNNSAPAVLVPTPCVQPIENGMVPAAVDHAVPLYESAAVEFASDGETLPPADMAALTVPKPPDLFLMTVGVGIPLHTPPVMVLELTNTWELFAVTGLLFPAFTAPPCKTALVVVPYPVG